MKFKTFARVGASMEIAIGATFAGLSYSKFFSNPDVLNIVSGDYPIYQKALAGVVYSIGAIGAAAGAALLVTGSVDMALGAHHYVGVCLWRDHTKNEKTRQNLDDYIEKMMTHRDDEMPRLSELMSSRNKHSND